MKQSVGVHREDLRERVDVGEDVAVRQHHALRHAVLPLEKMTVASASASACRAVAAGAATTPAVSRACEQRARSSSRRVISVAQVLEEHHARQLRRCRPSSRNCFDVRIVVMPACAIAASHAPRRRSVKFRFTGTRAGQRARAMLASAPPTDAGSSSPTIVLARACARGCSRATAAARPTSARPYVSFWPVLSAIANWPQCRLRRPDELRCSRSRRRPAIAHRLGAKLHDRLPRFGARRRRAAAARRTRRSPGYGSRSGTSRRTGRA